MKALFESIAARFRRGRRSWNRWPLVFVEEGALGIDSRSFSSRKTLLESIAARFRRGRRSWNRWRRPMNRERDVLTRKGDASFRESAFWFRESAVHAESGAPTMEIGALAIVMVDVGSSRATFRFGTVPLGRVERHPRNQATASQSSVRHSAPKWRAWFRERRVRFRERGAWFQERRVRFSDRLAQAPLPRNSLMEPTIASLSRISLVMTRSSLPKCSRRSFTNCPEP
jgi:hypothetical protein